MIKTIKTTLLATALLLTFNTMAMAEFTCKAYPELYILGIEKKDFEKSQFYSKDFSVEAEFSAEKSKETFDIAINKIREVMGQAPWPIDEIVIYKANAGEARVAIWLYKGCVLNMTKLPPDLAKTVVGVDA